MIFDELKTRGVKDVFLTCCDNLKGISEALKAAFPNVHIQKCVIHQIRNSTKHVSPKDVASFTSDMKKFINLQAMMQLLKHLILLKNLEGKNIHILSNHGKNNFDELVIFFDSPTEIRKMIYTTNTIENLNRNIKKITKTKGAFTNTQSLPKIIYMF